MSLKSTDIHTNMRHICRIHFIGIGGSGMNGIAEVLLNLGYDISGSDIQNSATTEHLKNLGANIYIGHCADHVNGADVIVTSSAVHHDNPEVVQAQKNNIPIIPRALMLAELMRFRHGIAVAGTHGKTTTTSLLTSILIEADLDPTFVIGGYLNSANANAKLGLGKYLVAEADESDASFLHLQPMSAIITNIDADHMGTYDGDFEKLRQTFLDFLHRLPFYGLAVVCLDDPEITKLISKIKRPVITYGSSPDCHFQITQFEAHGLQSKFILKTPNGVHNFEINLPGYHSALNACAAIAIAYDLNVPLPAIRRALRKFKGVGRRFQLHPETKITKGGSVTVMDDYGHHPTEISAVLSALKTAYPKRRIILAFQPHRYSRTQDHFDDFVKVLAQVDHLILTEVYAAGENPIPNINGQALLQAIIKQGKQPIFIDHVDKIFKTYQVIAEDGDLLLMMGAGSIGNYANNFHLLGDL